MTENRIDSAEASNLSAAMTDFSVAEVETDGITGSGESEYTNDKWGSQLGMFKQIPELKKAINAKATWTIGKGVLSSPDETFIMDKIKGNGLDTFASILENMVRVYHIGGDAFAEIIRGEDGELINLKPLDPSTIKIVAGKDGLIKRYEQTRKTKEGSNKEFKPEQMFHLALNRIADEIHGTSMIDALENIILMRNEAMADQKQLMHRHVKPLVKFILDTDDEVEIAAFKAKADKAIASGENLYLPKDTAEHEIISVAANATLNPLPWIDSLNNYFFQACGVPQIIVGGAAEFTEATAKIAYLAFEQTISEEQLFIMEQVGAQLGIEIELKFPASLENEILNDQSKDGNTAMQPNDTTAGSGQ